MNVTGSVSVLLSVTFTENISERHCAATVFTTYVLSFYNVGFLEYGHQFETHTNLMLQSC